MNTIILAAQIESIGDHLFFLGDKWAKAALQLFAIGVVVVTIFKKMSLKAGIGALIALVICIGIFNSREELAEAVQDELTKFGTPSSAPRVTGLSSRVAAGERAA